MSFLNFTNLTTYYFTGKIAQGVSFNKILDDIRDSLISSQTLERIYLLDNQDLRNIKKEFSLESHIKFHANDATSVYVWTELMKKLGEDSPVLYYKPQDSENILFKKEDFILIIMTSFQATLFKKFGCEKVCVDSTHGTNGYDFLLTSVVIVDEFGTGVPVAFLLSNRVDTVILTHYFSVIKGKIGTIDTKSFMSDDAPEFFNAWWSVMGKPTHQLLCAWHVDRNWRKNLCKIKGDQELKIKVYKHLRVLMESLNQIEFEELLQYIINELLASDATKDFGEYFLQYYAQRAQLWAYCYRVGLGINTNMYMEAMHKTLKYIYLEGKKNKRIDKCIHALIKLVRDHMFQRLKKNIKGKNSYRINLINSSHRKINEFKSEDIIEENNLWKIKSSSNSYVYTVQKISTDHHDKCELFCKVCNICIHNFSCTCPDYSIKLNLCKHIHAVSQKVSKVPEIQVERPEDGSLIELVSKHNSHQIINKTNNERIKTKLDILYAAISKTNVTNELALDIEKRLDAAINLLVKQPDQQRSTKEPTNKNVEKQIRFISTKKKRCSSNNALKKPELLEKQVIEDSCSKTMTVYASDHNYIKSTGLF